MNKLIVAVVSGAKARLLTLEAPTEPTETDVRLVERMGLISPTKELPDQNLWSSGKTGRNRGAGAQAHSYGDHRQGHLLEFDRRFAQAIAAKMTELIQTYPAQQLLLIGEPRILGLMRDSVMSVLPKQLKVAELAKDLCHLKPNELHAYLASKGLLPPRKRASSSIQGY